MFLQAVTRCPRDSGLLAAQRACIHCDFLSAGTAEKQAHSLHSKMWSSRVVLVSSEANAIVQERQAAPKCSTKAQSPERAGTRGGQLLMPCTTGSLSSAFTAVQLWQRVHTAYSHLTDV